MSTVLGFQQFGLPTVLVGLALAYSGSALYAWRAWSDRRRRGLRGVKRSLHIKLTGAMLLVLVLDGAGYLLAVGHVDASRLALVDRARGHLRRRRDADDHRRPGAARA